jgi:hypothetical protein
LALRARHIATPSPAQAAILIDEVIDSITGKRSIWSPSCLVDRAYALRQLGRADTLFRVTNSASVTPWLEAARAIAAGEFVAAADLFATIGSRPDEAYARLHAAEQLAATGQRVTAADQLEPALLFWRAVSATAYIRDAHPARSQLLVAKDSARTRLIGTQPCRCSPCVMPP